MYSKHEKGFTLLELMVVVSIIGLLVAIITTFLTISRNKAKDSNTQKVLSSLRAIATEEKNDTETFEGICSGGKVGESIQTLAVQNNVTLGQYHCLASVSDFVILFPLKSINGFWCVDAEGSSKHLPVAQTIVSPYTCRNVE